MLNSKTKLELGKMKIIVNQSEGNSNVISIRTDCLYKVKRK